MIRHIAIPLVFGLTTAPALAGDPRLVERLYDPDEVVRVEGRAKVQATIAFAEDERIENVAIGDSQSWQVTPNKRATLLFVKPLAPTAATNMTVVTSRRTYLFDLVANPSARPVYALRFTYPDAESEAEPVLAEGPDLIEQQAASDPYAVVDPATLNFAWQGTGDEGLLPGRTYDDGNATFLSWAADRPVPAILVKDRKGTEGPVNFTVRGNTVVVDGVPREIVLRSGGEMALLVNQGPVRPAASRPALAASPRLAEGREE